MTKYLVALRDEVDGVLNNTLCNDKDEVATLLANLDEDNYTLEEVKIVAMFTQNFKDYCVKEPSLETGKE